MSWAFQPLLYAAKIQDGEVEIAFDAASNSAYQAASSSYSWSHTCTGTDRCLFVGVSILSGVSASVSGVTYNSVAMTLVRSKASAGGTIRSELWRLVAPATGSNTVAVTLSAAVNSSAGAVSMTGVHQTTPTEADADATGVNIGTDNPATTVDVVTVADKDWVIDCVASDDTVINANVQLDERVKVTGAGGTGGMATRPIVTPAATKFMKWKDVDNLKTWTIVATAVKQVGYPVASFNAAWARNCNQIIIGLPQ